MTGLVLVRTLSPAISTLTALLSGNSPGECGAGAPVPDFADFPTVGLRGDLWGGESSGRGPTSGWSDGLKVCWIAEDDVVDLTRYLCEDDNLRLNLLP